MGNTPQLIALREELDAAYDALNSGDIKQAVALFSGILAPGRFSTVITGSAAHDAESGALTDGEQSERADVRITILAELATDARCQRSRVLQSIHLLNPALLDLNDLVDGTSPFAGKR